MTGEEAVTDVMGSILLVGITVAVMVTLSIMLIGFMEPEDQLRSDLELGVLPGTDGWGTGDETVRLRHLGGEPVPRDGFRIVVSLDGTETVFEGDALDGDWADGTLIIGEAWRSDLDIPYGTAVSISAISHRHSQLLNAATFTAIGTGAVSPGGTPPSADFSTSCLLLVCSFTDGSTDDGEILEWAWDFGGDGASTDQHPAHVFSGPGTYDVVLTVTDDEGDIDATSQSIEVVANDLTYVDCPMTATTGSVTACGNAQSATDSDAVATLTESTGPAAQQFDATTATGSGGSGDADDALGPADDGYYVLDSGGDQIDVTAFAGAASGSGAIGTVEMVIEGHAQGNRANDAIDLYADAGAGFQLVLEGFVPAPGADAERRVDITGLLASWSWQDVEDVQLRAEYDQQGGNDAFDYYVDAVWVEVTPEGGSELLVEASFTDVPAGVNELQVRYRVSTDAFDVEVWDGSSWADRGDLTSTTLATFTYTLDLLAGEDNGGDPRIRFVDQDGASDQGTLEIEYARVETT